MKQKYHMHFTSMFPCLLRKGIADFANSFLKIRYHILVQCVALLFFNAKAESMNWFFVFVPQEDQACVILVKRTQWMLWVRLQCKREKTLQPQHRSASVAFIVVVLSIFVLLISPWTRWRHHWQGRGFQSTWFSALKIASRVIQFKTKGLEAKS